MTNQEAIEFLKNMIDREAIGFVCPEREGDVAIWQYHVEALQMAISALQVQEAKAQLSAEGTTSDLISRQDAIEVIEEMQMPIMRSMFPEEQFVFKGMSEALSAIKDLPSAQPETEERKEESAQNVPKEDLISRKAAIDALKNERSDWNCDHNVPVDHCIDAIYSVPSAQPEPQWIPCSERLPEENVPVLLGVRFKDDFKFFVSARIDYNYWSGLGREIKGELRWMPLPEPYRAERRTDETD